MSRDNSKTKKMSLVKKALSEIRLLKKEITSLQQRKGEERDANEPIAVIGMACRYPGGSNTPEQFWDLLKKSENGIIEIPSSRWKLEDYYDPDPAIQGKMYTKYGGFIDDADKFDHKFFDISLREAKSMDPQQRLILEVAWEALERSGINPNELQGSLTGVFIGEATHDYSKYHMDSGNLNNIDIYSYTGTAFGVTCGRLSYILGLQGPALTVDTACSSSLVSIHLACKSLRDRESNLAIAGGVNMLIKPDHYVYLCKAGALSPDGKCKTFDESANGYVRGEGAGLIVLKRYSDAVKERDNILAVIKGSAINHDGHSNGLTAPNGVSQKMLIEQALEDAKVKSSEVSFVESHGTGTSLGDPIEVRAIGEVLAKGRTPGDELYIGSVKTNIGHLESGAGAAGVIKVILSLMHKQILPNLHFHKPNPLIPWDSFSLKVPTKVTEWNKKKRIAGVSSFGFGGTNAHLIIEEAPEQKAPENEFPHAHNVLCLSAKTEENLVKTVKRIKKFVDETRVSREKPLKLADICYTANISRTSLPYKTGITAFSLEDLSEKLNDYIDNKNNPSIFKNKGAKKTAMDKIAFIFSDLNADYYDIFEYFYEKEPVFKDTITKCNEKFLPYLDFSIIDLLSDRGKKANLSEKKYRYPVHFSLQYALAGLIKQFDIQPDWVIGNSVGEVAAALFIGTISLDTAVNLVAAGAGGKKIDEDVFKDEQKKSLNARMVSGTMGVLVENETIYDIEYWSRVFENASLDKPGSPMEKGLGFIQDKKGNYFIEIGNSEYIKNWKNSGLSSENSCFSLCHAGGNPGEDFFTIQAALFVEGVSINWRTYYSEKEVSLLILPSTCFEKTTCWLSDSTEGPVIKRAKGEAGHPLLGKRYKSPFIEDICFNREVSLDDTVFLRDHGFMGKIVMPATGYIEMLASLAEKEYAAGQFKLKGLTYHNPLIFTEENNTVLQTYVKQDTRGQNVFEIVSNTGEEWIKHTTGSIEPGNVPSASPLDINLIKSRCPNKIDRNTFYTAMEQKGYLFGKAHQAVTELYTGENQALGKIVLPELLQDEFDGFYFHPALLDSCCQVVLTMLPEEGDDTIFLNTGNERCLFYGRPSRTLWVLAAAVEKNASFFTGNIEIYNDNFQCVLKIEKYTTKKVDKNVLLTMLNKGSSTDHTDWLYSASWKKSPLQPVSKVSNSKNVLVFMDEKGYGKQIVNKTDCPNHYIMVYPGNEYIKTGDSEFIVSPNQGEHFTRLMKELQPAGIDSIIFLWGLDNNFVSDNSIKSLLEIQEKVLGSALNLVKAILDSNIKSLEKVAFVTKGAQQLSSIDPTINPAVSSLWGLGLVVSLECSQFQCVRIDLDHRHEPENVQMLCREISADTAGIKEEQIVYRNGERYVSRLGKISDITVPDSYLDIPGELKEDRTFQLTASSAGSIDNLSYETVKRLPPDAGEVEIEVLAAGFSFHDVLLVLNGTPGEKAAFGLECSGRVRSVGTGVKGFEKGDLVIAFASGCFAKYVRVKEEYVYKKPAELDLYSAATIPTSYLTAYHALYNLAKIKKDDKVLIHAGAGGVGMAAIQLCKTVGAEIYTTASISKWELLRNLGITHIYNSRTTEFAGQILQDTNGEGIDVVLNSFVGDYIPKNFSVLKSTGCFVEIGRKEILTPEEVRAYKEGVEYNAFTLGELNDRDPQKIQSIYKEIVSLFENKAISALPFTIVKPEAVKDAFRMIQKGKQIGKVLLSFERFFSAEKELYTKESTALVTGGLGGLGLETARWLASKEIDTAVLVSRREPNEETVNKIKEIEDLGINIKIMQGDVSKKEDVEALFKRIKDECPPLKGIIHTAGVTDDGLLIQQDWNRFRKVMAAKIDGSWNLHEQTRGMDLDFFILFSSLTSLIGSYGVANYAASNAFLDGLAVYRRQLGLPAVSINWGPWAEAGLLTKLSKENKSVWTKQGMHPLTNKEALAVLDETMHMGESRVGVLPVDWSLWLKQYASGKVPSVLLDFVKEPAAVKTAAKPIGQDTAGSTINTDNAEKTVRDTVHRLLKKVLSLDESFVIDDDESFKDFGLDSLMSVELRNLLAHDLNLELPATLLYNYSNGNSLIEYLADKMPVQKAAAKPERTVYEAAGTVDSVQKDTSLNTIKETIRTLLKRVLSVNEETEIADDESFKDYGLDSLMSVELRNLLAHEFKLDLPATLLYNYSDVTSLADYLSNEITDEPVVDTGPAVLEENLTTRESDYSIQSGQTANAGDGDEPIAIIGISCRFAGGITTPGQFWDMLKNGRDGVSDIPESRWNIDHYFDPDPDAVNKIYTRKGGFIPDLKSFDPLFFKISPKEAEFMDPKQRVFLEEAWKALEDSGYSDRQLSNINCGVYIGAYNNAYDSYLEKLPHVMDGAELMGNQESILSARISYFLNLKGASITIDTACSSSLVAIHLACKAIQRGEIQMAVSGGITANVNPRLYTLMSKCNMIAADGKTKAFADGANGMVPGEGVGVVILKSLKKAINDRDYIYGVIRGSGVNQDGKTNGITAPNGISQAELVEQVYKNAKINADSISLVEAHGTGTKMGDPIEVEALTTAFRKFTDKKQFCPIGSVKTNIAHAQAAAGVASLIKVLLCMKNKQIAPSLHCTAENHLINFKDSPFYVAKKLEPWQPKNAVRRAGVSSFGFSGTNCHVLIDEFTNECYNRGAERNVPCYLIPITAKSETAFNTRLTELQVWLQNEGKNYTIGDIGYTLLCGRSHFNVRSAVIVKDKQELEDKLAGKEEFLKNLVKTKSKISAEKKQKGKQLINELSAPGINSNDYSRKLTLLGDFFLTGGTFEWSKLFNGDTYYRIPMPAYPFDKTEYWIYPDETSGSVPDFQIGIQKTEGTAGGNGQESRDSQDSQDGIDTRYYRGTWGETAGEPVHNTITGTTLVLDPNNGLANERTREHFRSKFGQNACVFVTGGNGFNSKGQNEYEIRYEAKEEYTELLKSINSPERIIIFWAGDQHDVINRIETGSILNDTFIAEKQALIRILHHLYKGISTLKLKQLNDIYLVYHIDQDIPDPFIEAVSALARPISLIAPDVRFNTLQLVDFETTDNTCINHIFDEMSIGEKGMSNEIRYVGDKRYLKKIEEFSISTTNEVQLKNNGVYLITGGLGKLGLVFAEYLAKEYQANLVLTGRSEINSDNKKILEMLNSYGSSAVYFAVDVSNKENMKEVLDNTYRKFGKLDGIIHSAGTIGTKTFLEKSVKDVENTLLPKIAGTLILDDLTKEQDLDFFMVFSSASAFLGDFGQCDYAMGNRFMDNFIRLRELLCSKNLRQGRSITINWPTWREGGMHLNKNVEEMYFKTSGMVYFETPDGIDAFEAILKHTDRQYLVITGDKEKVEYFLHIKKRAAESDFQDLSAKTVSPIAGSSEDLKPAGESESGADSVALITKKVKEIVSEQLKIPPEQIDIDENLGNFGYDSIQLKLFSNILSEKLGISLTPSIFFTYSDIKSIAGYINEEYGGQLKLADEKAEMEPEDLNYNKTASPGSGHNKKIFEEITYVTGGEKPEVSAPVYPDSKKGRAGAEYTDEIAIIGAAGIFPGSNDLEEFWVNLENAKDLITEIPGNRWDWHAYYGDPTTEKYKTNSKWGGFISDVDKFDADFFNIIPREAEMMDPQQRVFMEISWKAIEDAGFKATEFSGRKIGVFAGVPFDDYKLLLLNNRIMSAQLMTGNANGLIANRISYFLNLKGPSELVDTSCSSALVAINRAVNSIKDGECEMAIVGSPNLNLSPHNFITGSMLGVLSPDGRCKTFDKKANGFVKGEGVGALVLCPLSKALEQNCHIYALIKGTAVNHGGKAKTLTAPNFQAQADLLTTAYKKAGFSIDTVTYIEAHGTGTELGDPVEIEGLKSAYKRSMKEKDSPVIRNNTCGLGSVKTNIGHLEPASGMAGIIKVILAMKNKKLPGIVNFSELNPYIDFKDTPFYIVDKTKEWDRIKDEHNNDIPRRAGVSSFGFGGVNAHVVLEEFDSERYPAVCNAKRDTNIFVLSAKNSERLKVYTKKVFDFIQKHSFSDVQELTNLLFTLQTGRVEMDTRLAIVVQNRDTLIEQLKDYLSNKNTGYVFTGTVEKRGETGRSEISDIEGLIESNSMSKLAALWTGGAEIDWNLFYKNGKPRRISAPDYPFSKNRYWLPVYQKIERRKARALHPLLNGIDYPATFSGNGIVFHSMFTNKDLVFKDHQVRNTPILPGVGYLEMAYSAFSLVKPGADITLSNVLWLRPLDVTNEKKDVQVIIKEESEKYYFQIRSSSDRGFIIHAKGEIIESQRSLLKNKEKMNIEEIQERCSNKIAAPAFYKSFKDVGIDYGPYFRGVISVWSNEQEALSQISIPMRYKHELDRFTLHPTLMDGALQTIMGLALQNGTLSSKPLVPFSVDTIEVFHPLKALGYAYVRMSGKGRYTISILDNKGLVCIKIHDIAARELNDPLTNFFYTPRWNPVLYSANDMKVPSKIEKPSKDVLIFYTAHSNGKEETLAEFHRDDRVISYDINDIKTQQDMDRIIEKAGGIDLIYFLTQFPIMETEMYDDSVLQQTQQAGIVTLFRMFHSLIKQNYSSNELALFVITNNVYTLSEAEPLNPFGAALPGFTLSSAKEFTRWNINYLDLSLEEDTDDIKTSSGFTTLFCVVESAMEKLHKTSGNFMIMRNGIVYTKKLVPLELPPIQSTPFKKGGVYLIIGGTGGIGYELCKYLAKNSGAHIVLIGRKANMKHFRERNAEIESLGGKLLYVSADVTDSVSMEQAVTKSESFFASKINGVIHSALVLNDKRIQNMDEKDLLDVLAPKVSGSFVLYDVFKEKPLDFMLFFSSAQSFSCNAGQSNYAAACTFTDVFADFITQKTSFPVKIINWGYWGSVGVVSSDDYKKKMAAQGIYSIEPEEGMEAVKRVVSHSLKQVVPIKADRKILDSIGIDFDYQTSLCPQTIPSVFNARSTNRIKPVMNGKDFLQAKNAFSELDSLSRLLLLSVFQKMGYLQTAGEKHNSIELRQKMNIIPGYYKLYDAMIDFLTAGDFIEKQGETIVYKGHAEEDLTLKKQTVITGYPFIEAHVNLLETCLNNYPEIVTGKVPATDIMFPNSSMELVEGIYKNDTVTEYFNKLVADSLRYYIESRSDSIKGNKKIQILEVGAGTGGTSSVVFDQIRDYQNMVQYVYSDISLGFIKFGKRQFGAQNPFVEFKVFDIEKDAEEFGNTYGKFDVIFATNVLHALGNIRYTLKNIKSLLKTNGAVIINEGTRVLHFATLCFGLLSGWWKFEDELLRLKNAPLLSSLRWNQVLKEEGFKNIQILGQKSSDGYELFQNVIIAESDGIVNKRVSTPVSVEPERKTKIESEKSQESKQASKVKEEKKELAEPAKPSGTLSDEEIKKMLTDLKNGSIEIMSVFKLLGGKE